MLIGSCSNDFIEIEPISDQSSGSFYNNASDLEQAVTAAYDALQPLYQGNSFDHFMEVRSDNTFDDNTTQSGGARAQFDNFSLASSNFMLNDAWTNGYFGIQRANIVLNRIDAIEDFDSSLKAIRIGEMKFLRAFNYFNIARIWGDAPLVLTETENPFEGFDHTRDGVDAIYTQIITDLQDAINALPTRGNTQDGRATWGAAQALLGKVQLTRGQYSDAATTLGQIVSSGDYDLLAAFKDIFDVNNEHNIESIFEVQYKSGTNGEGNNITDPSQNQDVNNRPSPNIMTFFTANWDDRFDASVDTTNIGLLHSAKQLDARGSDATFGFNTIVLRYGDVLLMAAESLNEVSYDASGDAFTYLNWVRSRANAIPFTAADLPNQESFRQAIATERRLELAFENHRWFDLVRTDKAIEVMTAANGGEVTPTGGSSLPYTIQQHQLLYPIPLTQIDASGGILTPNPGY